MFLSDHLLGEQQLEQAPRVLQQRQTYVVMDGVLCYAMSWWQYKTIIEKLLLFIELLLHNLYIFDSTHSDRSNLNVNYLTS